MPPPPEADQDSRRHAWYATLTSRWWLLYLCPLHKQGGLQDFSRIAILFWRQFYGLLSLFGCLSRDTYPFLKAFLGIINLFSKGDSSSFVKAFQRDSNPFLKALRGDSHEAIVTDWWLTVPVWWLSCPSNSFTLCWPPRSFFDVQHGIELGSIRTQDMPLYSWDSASHAWTNIKNHVRIYGDMIDVQRGQHMIASPPSRQLPNL